MKDTTGAIEKLPRFAHARRRGASRPIFCITAAEAYPRLERWFLEARKEIVASYRIFEPVTRLRTDEARAVGEDWFDLIVHVLRKGVEITIYITDFDPVAAPGLHRATWSSVRQLHAAAEIAGPGAAPLNLVSAGHPARVGLLPRLFFTPSIANELRKRAAELNRMAPLLRRAALRDMPGLAPFLADTGSGVRARFALPAVTPATHHQKVAVFDRTRVTLGGLDLNERRWDTQAHEQPAEETWHDVQMFIEDAGRAAAAARHILTLQRVTGGLIPAVQAPGLLRTLSRRRRWNLFSLSPRNIVDEIARAHRQRFAGAQRLVYIETQFFRDLRTAGRLARAGRLNRELGLIMVLPAAPEDVAFEGRRRADARLGEFLQARCIQMVRRAFGKRALLVAPVQPRSTQSRGRDALWGGPIVYVHAKVSIFDEEAAIVSSANLNGRSLYWDSELGIELRNPEDVVRLRRQCFEHWLPADAGPEFHDPKTAVAAWRRLALENLHAHPERRRGFVLPYDPTPGERFGRDLPAVPKEIV